MAIHCPYCRNALGLKGAKPGRYSTKCPKCTKKFILSVPSEPGAEPVVQEIPSERLEETQDVARARPVTGVEETIASAPAVDPNATGAWTVPDPAAQAGPNASRDMATAAAATSPVPPQTPTTAAAEGERTVPWVTQGSEQPTEVSSSVSAPERPSGRVPTLLGGYQVLKELGHGGMGAVYLARQLSLDRNVALKVMKPEWAGDPTFVSRFTREAYAAAQLVHHNVVQIYDFGQDRGTSFFSMEYVQGQTLSQLLRTEKRLECETAAGYVLQAARGLKQAHEHSMIHRDIKPDNLMLNHQGVVKVADLGLVKTPAMAEAEEARESGTAVVTAPGTIPLASNTGQITMANVAMGTPAFMAPEQARDAASVDARADIYSLGCTLYDLVTGRPPFEGNTAVELMTKHQSEPIVPPELVVKRVPKALSEIILKMVAKKPEDRYPNLGEVIKALEEYLGLPVAGPFTPKEEHANLLAESVEAFHASPTARLRSKILLTALGACAIVVLLGGLSRQGVLATGFLGLGLMTAFAYFVVTGLTEKTHLFLRTRELVFASGPADWLMALAAVVLFLTMLVVFHLFWAWAAFGIVAILLSIWFHAVIDRKVKAERQEPIDRVLGMLRTMRLHGVDEEAVRQFVCKYSGERWEEFYETLFGYEAKLAARDRWGRGERGRLRPTWAAWRDPVIRWIDSKQKTRREEREKKLLQKIEEKNLEARGVNQMTARRQAKRSAEAMVMMASELREAAKLPDAVHAPRLAIGPALREAAAKPEKFLVDREKGLIGPRSDGLLGWFLGPRPRFLTGALLLGGCLLWMHQNDLLTAEKLQQATEKAKAVGLQAAEAARKAAKTQDLAGLKSGAQAAAEVTKKAVEKEAPTDTVPLEMPMLPRKLTALFHSFLPGLGGLILLASSFFPGVRMSAFAFPAAAIALLGPALMPGTVGAWACAGIATALGVAGFVFGRSRA